MYALSKICLYLLSQQMNYNDLNYVFQSFPQISMKIKKFYVSIITLQFLSISQRKNEIYSQEG